MRGYIKYFDDGGKNMSFVTDDKEVYKKYNEIKLNNLKSQHTGTEVTTIDNKTKTNANDILALEKKLQQKEDTINENEIGISIFRGFFFYLQQNHLVYECKVDLF